MNAEISIIYEAIKSIKTLPESTLKYDTILALNLLLAQTIQCNDWLNSMHNLPELELDFTL